MSLDLRVYKQYTLRQDVNNFELGISHSPKFVRSKTLGRLLHTNRTN